MNGQKKTWSKCITQKQIDFLYFHHASIVLDCITGWCYRGATFREYLGNMTASRGSWEVIGWHLIMFSSFRRTLERRRRPEWAKQISMCFNLILAINDAASVEFHEAWRDDGTGAPRIHYLGLQSCIIHDTVHSTSVTQAELLWFWWKYQRLNRLTTLCSWAH